MRTPPRFEFASWKRAAVLLLCELPQNIVPPPWDVSLQSPGKLTGRPLMLASTVARLGKMTLRGGQEMGLPAREMLGRSLPLHSW